MKLFITATCTLLALLNLVMAIYIKSVVDNPTIDLQRIYNLLMTLVALASAAAVAFILQSMMFLTIPSLLYMGIWVFVVMTVYKEAEEIRKSFASPNG